MDGERNIGNPDPFNKAVSLINQALDVLKNSSGDQQTSCQNTENTNSSLNSMLPSTLPTSTSSNSSGRATPKQCTPETSTQRPEPLELQRLFPFFGPRGTSGRMKSQRSSPYTRYRPKETWTHTFICLSDIKDSIVPSREKKRLLKDGGLCEKKVVFNDKKGSFSHVKTTLEREFSQLQDLNGAFEILRSCGSRRLLEIIPIPPQGYTVPMLKEALGQAIGYVRPLQKNLKLKKTNQVKEDLDSTSAPSVPCMNCGQVIPIPSLREHEQDCGGGSSAMVQLHSEPDVSR